MMLRMRQKNKIAQLISNQPTYSDRFSRYGPIGMLEAATNEQYLISICYSTKILCPLLIVHACILVRKFVM